MLSKLTHVGAVLAAMAMQPATAAPATERGADGLLKTFQTYVGGDGSGVTVKANGADYLVSIDLQKAVMRLDWLGVALEPATLSYRVAVQDDGTYRVFDLTLPPLTIKKPNAKDTYLWEGASFDGVFDPKVAGFTKVQRRVEKFVNDATGSQTSHTVESNNVWRQVGVQVGPGVGSFEQHYTSDDELMSLAIDGKSLIDFSTQAWVGDLRVTGLRNQALWDVWAFFAARESRDKIAADTEILKARLGALLPIFDHFDQAVTAKDFRLETSKGPFSLGEIGLRLATTGAVEKGAYSFNVSASQPVFPSGLLRPWQARLVPTELSIGAELSGLNVNAAARQMIAGLEPAAKHPVAKEAMAKAAEALWTSGPLKVTFVPSYVKNATYQVQMSGGAVIAEDGPPLVHAIVTAKGIDAAMDVLDVAKQTDASATRAVLFLVTAKALGKSNPDGSMSWDIELGADGAATVNGTKLSGK